MIDTLIILDQATRSIREEIREWFRQYPSQRPWTIVSDYCIGDDQKANDAFSFVIMANHDTAKEISEYIRSVAPADLKKVREVPRGIIQYLTCQMPINYSISFVLDRKSALLRQYLRLENMLGGIEQYRILVESLSKNSRISSIWFGEALKRLNAFETELQRKNVNAALARQIFLVSGFLGLLIDLISETQNASHVRWISDRDALLERHDGIVHDLAWLNSILLAARRGSYIDEGNGAAQVLAPESFIEIPEKTGPNRFDEFVRLADYLAGTVADVDTELMSCTREKFAVMFNEVFVLSKNNRMVQLFERDQMVSARSVRFGIPLE